jgi:hypothetical protein
MKIVNWHGLVYAVDQMRSLQKRNLKKDVELLGLLAKVEAEVDECVTELIAKWAKYGEQELFDGGGDEHP